MRLGGEGVGAKGEGMDCLGGCLGWEAGETERWVGMGRELGESGVF